VPDPSLQLARRDTVRQLNLGAARLTVTPGSATEPDATRQHEVVLTREQIYALEDILDNPTSYYEFAGVIGCLCDQFRLTVTTDSQRYTSVFCSWCSRFWVPDSDAEHQLDVPLSKEGAAQVEAFFRAVLQAPQ